MKKFMLSIISLVLIPSVALAVKLTAEPELTSPATNDLFWVVDVSDTTDDVGGSTKKITRGSILQSNLSDIDGLAVTDGNIIVGDGANFVAESGATARASLGLTIGTNVLAQQTIGIANDNLLEVDGAPNSTEYARFTANGLEGRTEAEFKGDFNLEIGTDVQAQDAELAAIAGLTSAADKLPYFTGSGTASVADITSAARTMIGNTGLVLQSVDVSVSSAEILSLHTTPKTIVAAQGANTGIIFAAAYVRYNYNTTAYAGIAGGDNLSIKFSGGSTNISVIETVGFIDQTSNQYRTSAQSNSLTVFNNEVLLNTALQLSLNGAVTTGDGTFDLRVFYYVIDNTTL